MVSKRGAPGGGPLGWSCFGKECTETHRYPSSAEVDIFIEHQPIYFSQPTLVIPGKSFYLALGDLLPPPQPPLSSR